MRTTLGFRQQEFIQNGEVKVISKEQNAGQSRPAQSAVPKEIWKYKTLRYVGFVAKRKKTDNHRRLLRNEVVPQKPINKFMIRLLSITLFIGW